MQAIFSRSNFVADRTSEINLSPHARKVLIKMQQQTRLSLHPAAWFFIEKSGEIGAQKNISIKPPLRVGRDPHVNLCLPCPSVSGNHAVILEENGDLWLHDLKSTNGTFVNGTRIQSKVCLREDDTVQFGTTVFQVARDQGPDCESISKIKGKPYNDSSDSQTQRFVSLITGGVVPFFQPIVQFGSDSQSVMGYEVLGRSQLFGLQTPAQMFAAASRMKMEAELSQVLRKHGVAVADELLPEKYSLFVNTHPAELECEGLEESLFEIRKNHPSRPIVLEVHESVLNHPEEALRLQSTLHTLNIRLAFHDFGAGQVRLAELAEVMPDVVKFDVKLVQGIDQASPQKQRLVASLVKMVSELGIVPLAECVEHASENEVLRQLGFQLGQGFHYGRPSSIEECRQGMSRRQAGGQPEKTASVNSSPENSTNSQSRASNEISTVGPNDANWLLTRPQHYYTIQVLSAISQERAQEHISKQENPEQFAIFCKQGRTRMLYIVVYGVFEDRSAAKAASTELADATISPWIRMLSSVHAEIRSGYDSHDQ